MHDVVLFRRAERHFEIVGRDPLVPVRQGEAHVAVCARRDHQRRFLIFVAAAAKVRFGQDPTHLEQAACIGLAGGDQLAVAGVADPHRRTCHRRGISQRGDPDQRAFAAPFEVHRHVGDQRAGGDIAQHRPSKQRRAERRAGQFDHVEALARERDADDFEILALARKAKLHGAAARHQQRLVAGVVDRGAGAVLVLDEGVVAPFGLIEPAHPGSDLRVVVSHALALSRDRDRLAGQRRFDRAHGDRQAGALARLDDPESGGEFDQRRRRGKAHREREPDGIGQRAAGQVLDPGRKNDLRGAVGREAAGEVEIGNLRRVLLIVVDRWRPHRTIGEAQPNLHGHGAIDRRGEAHVRLGNRIAGRLAVHAAAFEIGCEGLTHGEVIALVAPRWLACQADNGAWPDQRHVMLGRQRPAALQCHDSAQRIAARDRIAGQIVGNLRVGQERGTPIVILAQAIEDLVDHRRREHVNRRRFTDPIYRARSLRGDRGGIGGNIGRDEEDLILVDLVIAVAGGKDRQHRRSASIDCETGLALNPPAAQRGEARAQLDIAGETARQWLAEFDYEGLLIGPAPRPRTGAIAGRRRLGTRIAQRHHRLGKTQGEAIDRAAAGTAGSRRCQHDLRRGVALRGQGEQRQCRQYQFPASLHVPLP